MKLYHIATRKLFDKFGRNWFPLYAFYNCISYSREAEYNGKTISEYEARDILTTLNRRKLVIREIKKPTESPIRARLLKNDLEITEKWRLSGKAIYELNDVFSDISIEVTDSDFSEYAKLTLVEE